MNIIIERPPRTAMEVFKMLPEGTLCEVIANQLYMAPPPNELHQKTAFNLVMEIGNFVQRTDAGEVRFAPYGVYLDKENVVEPDLFFISKEHSYLIHEDGLHGVPDMNIEILSPSNEKHDTVSKKKLYQRFGVKEYWIVNPKTREAIGFELDNDHYTEFAKAIGKLSSKLLSHTSF